MGQKEAEVTTRMSVKECANAFQAAAAQSRGASAKLGEIAARMKGNDNSGFFTPTNDSPFSGLDDDRPDFSVGVWIGKFVNGANGAGTAVHMYVWDRGDHREVHIISPHGLTGGGKSQRLVQAFAGHLR